MSRGFRWVLAVAAAVAVAAALPLATAPLVLLRAQQAADGRPYCIEAAAAPHGQYYETVRSLFHLSAARMRARRDSRGDHPIFHAVLFVERRDVPAWGEPRHERYNWSYRGLDFDPIAGQGHAGLGDAPPCTPQADFGERLLFGP